MQEYKPDESDAGMRADVFVAARYPQCARSTQKSLFERHEVLVNGKPAKPGYKLRSGDILALIPNYLQTQPEAIELPVLYQDTNVVVINKPAGILTHSKGALNLEPTVASFLAAKIDDKRLSGSRAGIVHRLDRATSGVIICARNQLALGRLQRQFATRKAKKTYVAIVEGVPKATSAIIDLPIDRDSSKPQRFKVATGGKPAQTRYEVKKILKRAGSDYALMELQPVTGRTHQLRIHLAYIGHPVVGDYVYGRNGRYMMLHARKLELKLPDGQLKTFSAPPPKPFKDFTK